MAARPPRREALATPERSLPGFGSADEPGRTDIVPTPLRLLEDSRALRSEPRYTICGEFEYGGLPDVHLAFLEGAAGFRRAVVVQRLGRSGAAGRTTAPQLSPDALLGCHTRHPNVIPVLDLIERNGEHLLVLEYVVSTTLSRLLWHGNRMPLPVSAAIVSGVLHALHAAHGTTNAHGEPLEIVHAGISPEKVLVGVDGTARLIHFGQAKRGLMKGVVQATHAKSGQVSPEQVFDRRADARSDVFGAGVLLWECLVGKPLLEGGSAVDAMLRFMSRPAPSPSSFNPSVPAALDLVVGRALEPTPERRFQTALEFLEALEALVELASREEVARYVEGVAWSSLHEQRLLLRGPSEEAPADLPISQFVDREEARLNSGPRACVGPDDPTLSRGFFVQPNLAELQSAWMTREADEPTKIDGVRPTTAPPVALLPDATAESEAPLNLSPSPPPPRIRVPRTQNLPSNPEIPDFRAGSPRFQALLWGALVLGAVALVAALARTPYGRSLRHELTQLMSHPTPKAAPATQTLTVPIVAPPVAAAPPKPVAVAPAPAPTPASSLRVLTLDDLPVAAEPRRAEEEPSQKKKRAKKTR